MAETWTSGGRVRTGRREVPIGLLILGALACLFALINDGGAVRVAITIAFLLVGPGWAIVGFMRRASDALTWLLAIALSTAIGILVGQAMLETSFWHPAVALVVVYLLSAPALVRHAVVAQ